MLPNNLNLTSEDIQIILELELKLHPESHITDIYKLLYQANYGPTHMTPDRQQIYAEIDAEIKTVVMDTQLLQYQDIGNGQGFIRINLASNVFDGFMLNALTDMILESRITNEQPCSYWRDQWQQTLTDMNRLIHPTQTDIRALEETILNNALPRHSEMYRQKYDPHYRLIHHSLLSNFLTITRRYT